MKCPKCGSEMQPFGEVMHVKTWWCPLCGHEEKLGGGKE